MLQQVGWHFSYLGNDPHVQSKLASFIHQEFGKPNVLGGHGVAGIMTQELDLFGLPGCVWSVAEINDYCPKELRRNPVRFGYLWIPNTSIIIDRTRSLERDTLVKRRINWALSAFQSTEVATNPSIRTTYFIF